MFDNLGTAVQAATEDDLSSAFLGGEDKSAKNKTDDTKTKGGKTKDEKPASKKTSSSKERTGLTTKKDIITDLPEDDEEIFDTGDDNDDEDETEDDDDVKDKKKKKVVTEEDNDDDSDDEDESQDDDEDEEDENDDTDDNDEDEDEAGGIETDEQVQDFLKKRGELLIKKGEWVDFDGREEFEWTEENFAQLELDQRKYQKDKMVEEILDSFGPTGREIATYTANGGNPDDLIDIFKEQQRVENLSVDTEEAQRATVLKYETEFLGKKPERVKKYIDSLVADKELKAAAEEAKEAMETTLADQATELQEKQEAIVKQKQQKQKDEIQRFSNDVSALINSDKSIPADEKSQLLKVLTKFDKRLPNGTPVNEFYNKFAEFKKDLPNYIKFVRFVMNPEKFTKGLKTEGKNQAVEQSFKLARTANKSKKLKSSDSLSNSGKVGKTKFQLL